uniref:Phospholipase A2 domain-containing protein n=1 Tax=Cyanistes caeruleus TaxID=156563 RepID=A0A8C0V5Y5_CYACU
LGPVWNDDCSKDGEIATGLQRVRLLLRLGGSKQPVDATDRYIGTGSRHSRCGVDVLSVVPTVPCPDLGSGAPRCCHAHDCCYKRLVSSGCSPKRTIYNQRFSQTCCTQELSHCQPIPLPRNPGVFLEAGLKLPSLTTFLSTENLPEHRRLRWQHTNPTCPAAAPTTSITVTRIPR